MAYFIADIGSYFQLKIVSFFPILRKKIPTESYKFNKKKSEILETRATSQNPDWCNIQKFTIFNFIP